MSIKIFLASLPLWLGLNPCIYAQLQKADQYYKALEKDNKHTLQTIQFIQEDMNLVEDYAKLSQIILLRHGEPALRKKGWRKRKEAIKYTQDYDSVGVYQPVHSPLHLRTNDIQVLYTSNLNRSISTARQLFDREDIEVSDSLFRELERKVLAFPNIKLPLSVWLMSSRILWAMGLNKKGIESFSQGKSRARMAANFLEKDALLNGKTLLVSHGFLNYYLAKYLKKNGWVEVFDGGHDYLSQKMLVKYKN